MSSPLELSIIIPCYNERENLQRGVLDEVAKELDKMKIKYEVIISDDESTDGSKELVKKFKHPNFRLLENLHGGKAFALKSGLEKAVGKFVLFTDMDQSTPIVELKKLMIHTKKGEQVVIGSRGKNRTNFNIIRQLASQIFSVVRRSMLLSNIVDTQCGFKLFNTELAKKIFSKMEIFNKNNQATGWVVAAWDVEFLFIAEKLGHKIIEVPVKWEDNDQSTQKKRTAQKFIKESIDMLKQIIRVRLNDWKGVYEK